MSAGLWRVEFCGESRKVYEVEAESADEAIAIVESGDVRPYVTEVSGAEMTACERVDS